LTFFRHFRHVTKFRHVENGHFWCYFDVLGNFMTFCFLTFFRHFRHVSKFGHVESHQESSRVVKRHLTTFYDKKFFDPKTPLFCQKRHLTFGAAGHDLLTPSSNLASVMSQRSCVPNLVTLGQEGHELS
jgi:hypothetical protein